MAPTATSHSYKLLTKKLAKIQSLMKALSLKKQEKTKGYRGYERKQKEYQKQLQQTPEFKEKKLKKAKNDLTSSAHSTASVDISAGSDSSSSSSGSSGSSSSDGSSSSGEEEVVVVVEEKAVDYKLTLKKYDKIGLMIHELEQDHGVAEARTRKDYLKYQTRQTEYLGMLRKTAEWKKTEEADEKSRAKAAHREVLRIELEQQKVDMLAKLRQDRAKKDAIEDAKEQAYLLVEGAEQKILNEALQKEADHLREETQKRGDEYDASLLQQEEQGLIHINRK